MCNKGLHYFVQRGKNVPDNEFCFTRYHDDLFYGLARSDSYLTGQTKKDWMPPTCIEISQHAKYMRRLKNQM